MQFDAVELTHSKFYLIADNNDRYFAQRFACMNVCASVKKKVVSVYVMRAYGTIERWLILNLRTRCR